MGRKLVEYVDEDLKEGVTSTLEQALGGICTESFYLTLHTGTKSGELTLLVSASPSRDYGIGGDVGDGANQINGVVLVGTDYTARKKHDDARRSFLASFSHELRTPLHGILGMLSNVICCPEFGGLSAKVQDWIHMTGTCGKLLMNLVNDILDLSKFESGQLESSSEPFDLHASMTESLELASTLLLKKPVKLISEIDSAVPRFVRGDEQRFRQVILNLLTNAVKFTSVGTIKVRCWVATPEEERDIAELMAVVPASEVKAAEEQNFSGVKRVQQSAGQDSPATFARPLAQSSCICVDVEDTGIGMLPGDSERVFDIFWKNNEKGLNQSGSGLGLAICKRLMEVMGGRIRCVSELGVGSTFKVVLRLGKCSEDLYRVMTRSPEIAVNQLGGRNLTANGSPVEASVTRNIHLLIVEDNAFNVAVVENYLSDYGYVSWEVACNGKEACTLLQEKGSAAYDVVLMDCEMPIMNGYKATTTIREMEANPAARVFSGRAESNSGGCAEGLLKAKAAASSPRWGRQERKRLPIIGLSADAMQGSRGGSKACAEVGMDAFYTKPISKVQLKHAIFRQLAEAETRPPSNLVRPANGALKTAEVAGVREAVQNREKSSAALGSDDAPVGQLLGGAAISSPRDPGRASKPPLAPAPPSADADASAPPVSEEQAKALKLLAFKEALAAVAAEEAALETLRAAGAGGHDFPPPEVVATLAGRLRALRDSAAANDARELQAAADTVLKALPQPAARSPAASGATVNPGGKRGKKAGDGGEEGAGCNTATAATGQLVQQLAELRKQLVQTQKYVAHRLKIAARKGLVKKHILSGK
jgi:signal transduction histidine kinase/CheY-like chemotaxis protein